MLKAAAPSRHVRGKATPLKLTLMLTTLSPAQLLYRYLGTERDQLLKACLRPPADGLQVKLGDSQNLWETPVYHFRMMGPVWFEDERSRAVLHRYAVSPWCSESHDCYPHPPYTPPHTTPRHKQQKHFAPEMCRSTNHARICAIVQAQPPTKPLPNLISPIDIRAKRLLAGISSVSQSLSSQLLGPQLHAPSTGLLLMNFEVTIISKPHYLGRRPYDRDLNSVPYHQPSQRSLLTWECFSTPCMAPQLQPRDTGPSLSLHGT